jgi:sugar/nucleoside kinase (ribokinase family)
MLCPDRLPKPGETLGSSTANSGRVLPGGKGANQAVAVAQALKGQSGFEVHWAGRYGNDAHAGTLPSVMSLWL